MTDIMLVDDEVLALEYLEKHGGLGKKRLSCGGMCDELGKKALEHF